MRQVNPYSTLFIHAFCERFLHISVYLRLPAEKRQAGCVISFPDNNWRVSQTVGPRCGAAITPGGAATPPLYLVFSYLPPCLQVWADVPPGKLPAETAVSAGSVTELVAALGSFESAGSLSR